MEMVPQHDRAYVAAQAVGCVGVGDHQKHYCFTFLVFQTLPRCTRMARLTHLNLAFQIRRANSDPHRRHLSTANPVPLVLLRGLDEEFCWPNDGCVAVCLCFMPFYAFVVCAFYVTYVFVCFFFGGDARSDSFPSGPRRQRPSLPPSA